MVGIPAREMNKADSDALILLQGIIDAWFEEDDGLVLVDYKTDRVKGRRREYTSGPLPDPALLLRKGTCPDHREKVKEAVIYSLALQKEIPVPINL